MSRPQYLTLEELVNEVMENSSDDESENESICNSETEEENNVVESDSNESCISDLDEDIAPSSITDPLYIGKDGTIWNPEPYTIGRSRAENIINLRPGITRYASSRVENIRDAMLLFFPPSVTKVIIENSNKYGKELHGDKHLEIDEDLLHAFLAVLILAGVYNNLASPIKAFYTGKNVFITGATGFVGVTIVEKLLRDIPEIGTIYLLMRPKKGKTVAQRLEEIRKNSVFDKFKELKLDEKRFEKIVPIEGDVGQDHLGISEVERQVLIDNVHVVFHSAATLDFFQSLKETTNINLLGTRRVVELCKQLTKLEALVHVSSAYVNSYITEVEEKLYPAPDDPEKVIHLADTLSDEALKELEPKLLKDHPNTYTFTKHLAEHEVANVSSRFPCGIVRPSMITAAWKQPLPGWTISKNGPQGFFMGASRGILRRLPLDPTIIMDYIPVDVVVNAIIATGYYVNALKVKNAGKPAELQIFHLTSSTYRPFRFETLVDKINVFLHEYPLVSAVWYPHLKMVKSLFIFRLGAILFHFIPGFFLDLVTKLSGGRPILMRLHKSVWNSLNTLERFIFTEWHYDSKHTLALSKQLDPRDREVFFIDIGELAWDDYFLNTIMGVRQYLSKESPKNLAAAKRKDKILLALHVALQLAFYYGIFKFFIVAFGLSNAKAALILPVVYFLMNLI